MADFLLFAENLLEGGTVTVTSEAAGKPVTRLYDRDKSPVWQATSTAQQDIDIDTGAMNAVTAVALVGQTLGAGVEIYRGASPPATVLTAGGTATVDPMLYTFGVSTARYWRIRLLTSGVTPSLGEVFLGSPLTFTLPPYLDSATPGTLGNVRRDRSPAGYLWAVRRGVARTRLPYRWTGMSAADLARLELAFGQTQQGAKNLIVQDELGNTYWVSWLADQIQAVKLAPDVYEVPDQLFEEAL